MKADVFFTLVELRVSHMKGVANCKAYANLDCAEANDAKYYLKLAAKHQRYVDALNEVLKGVGNG